MWSKCSYARCVQGYYISNERTTYRDVVLSIYLLLDEIIVYYFYYYYYIIPFMQGILTYIPEPNHVSRGCSGAAIPRILLMVHIALSAILNSFVLLH
jgi:hypothetical protein